MNQFFTGGALLTLFIFPATFNAAFASDESLSEKTSTISTTIAVSDTTPKDLRDTIVLFPTRRAEFPNGQAGWMQYITPILNKHIDDFGKEDFDTCVVRIVIDKEGKPLEVAPIRQGSQLLFKISEDAILNGPSWVPAEKNGKRVKSYREQTIILAPLEPSHRH